MTDEQKKKEKILIIGPSWVGDMVFLQSLLKKIKKHRPSVHIAVVAPKGLSSLMSRMAEIDQQFFLPAGHKQLKLKARYQLAQEIKEHQFDQAIILPGSLKSALIPWFAKIPKRIGYKGEMRYGLINDIRPKLAKGTDQTREKFVNLYTDNQPNQVAFDAAKFEIDEVNLKNSFIKYELDLERKKIGLFPGAAFGSAKCWPIEYYIEVASHYIKQDWQVCIFGGKVEQPMGAKIAEKFEAHSCIDLTGKTQLGDTVDLISTMDGCIGNDSGLSHIAAGHGKPIIAFYGPTPPEVAPIISDYAKIMCIESLACRPCKKRECPLPPGPEHHACLINIKPKEVIETFEALLKKADSDKNAQAL